MLSACLEAALDDPPTRCRQVQRFHCRLAGKALPGSAMPGAQQSANLKMLRSRHAPSLACSVARLDAAVLVSCLQVSCLQSFSATTGSCDTRAQRSVDSARLPVHSVRLTEPCDVV